MKDAPNKQSNPINGEESGYGSLIMSAMQLLPKQQDVPGLLRVLSYCVANQIEFSTICLMLETPLPEDASIYTLNAHSESVECGPLNFLREQGRYAFFRQMDVRYLDQKTLAKELPDIIQSPKFKEAQNFIFVPLPLWVNGYHGTLLFLQESSLGKDSDILKLCRMLGGAITNALTRIVERKELGLEAEALRRERDRLNILVNVGQVINSTLELEKMIDTVAVDLTRFFAIKDMVLAIAKDREHIEYYGAKSTHKLDGRKVLRACVNILSGTLCERILNHKGPKLFREAELRQTDKKDQAALFFLTTGNCYVLGLPLRFRDENIGVLFLANDTVDVFTHDSITLLTQIADTLACATHHARDYASARLAQTNLAEENRYLSAEIEDLRTGCIIGKSPGILNVLRQVELVAASDSTVLLLGETGTGKEPVAEAIHRLSKRKSKRMIKINCAAVPSGLLESELFGYEKGAFTGAVNQSKGRFELADGSTLMLDEVGDLPVDLQPKLLRILQTRELERLGGHTLITVDVRVIAATNRDLAQMVEEERFRDDLFYRLNVFPIEIPPLRARREDIPLLADHFMRKIARSMGKSISSISDASLNMLCEHDWPGNVRELANVIERAVILTSGDTLEIPRQGFVTRPKGHVNVDAPKKKSISMPEPIDGDGTTKEGIIAAVRACNGLIAGPRGVAARLGIKRTTLLSRMKRFGLNVKDIIGEE